MTENVLKPNKSNTAGELQHIYPLENKKMVEEIIKMEHWFLNFQWSKSHLQEILRP